MDELQKIDIKVYADQGDDIPPAEFVAVLQRWIREHSIPGVLIDVADYSHIPQGQGVILVGHEFNISIDYNEGRMGLLFHYKRPAEKRFGQRVKAALDHTFKACQLLEQEPEFQARLKFNPGNFLFIANDRLNAANDDDAFEHLGAMLAEQVESALKGEVSYERRADDPRNRLAIEVRALAPAK